MRSKNWKGHKTESEMRIFFLLLVPSSMFGNRRIALFGIVQSNAEPNGPISLFQILHFVVVA